jgi:hypothetical protein
MFRFLARFLGFWVIAAALVVAVVDGAKSIAASGLVLTPVAETYLTVLALIKPANAETALPTAPSPLDVPLNWLLSAPTAVVLVFVGIALLVLGARRRRPFLSREFAA